MDVPAAGTVALIPFAFTDLSRSKLRPAVVVAHVGRGDVLLCMVASNPYADPDAVALGVEDFDSGGLAGCGYARRDGQALRDLARKPARGLRARLGGPRSRGLGGGGGHRRPWPADRSQIGASRRPPSTRPPHPVILRV